MKRAFVTIVLLTCAFFLDPEDAVSQARQTEVRSEASQAATDAAIRRLEAGDLEGAREASREALDLDPENADARYLSAIIAFRMNLPLPEAERNLRASLAGGRFRRFSEENAALFLAEILVRIKKYSESLELTDRPLLASDPGILYLRCRALRFLGNDERFLETAESGLDRFPSDARIPREVLEYAVRTSGASGTMELIRRIEGRIGIYRYLDPELLIYIAPFRSTEEERRDTILEYRAPGRKHPKAAIAALELGILNGEAASREFFSFATLTWSDLRRLRDLLDEESGTESFTTDFLAYSGEIGHDDNGDGIPETRTSYKQGEIQTWTLDFNQDAILETTLRFRENVPSDGMKSLGDDEVFFEYGQYPQLARLRFSGPKGVREYLFSPGALDFPVVELSREAEGKDGRVYAPIRTSYEVPGESECISAAYRVTERPSPDTAENRVTDLHQGLPLLSRVVTQDRRDGILLYRGGSPSVELADMDGDGIFESRFLYEIPAGSTSKEKSDVKPSWFETDFDLDGEYEYREGLHPPFRKTWDYNQDGKTDARTSALSDGGELREFSRRFDGRLDTVLLVRDGRIERVIRAGRELPLTPDSGGRVLWVGRKPFDFGASVPDSGSGVRNGIRYRVVRFGDQIFAEAVD